MRRATADRLAGGGSARATLVFEPPAHSLPMANGLFLPATDGGGRVLISTARFGAGLADRRARLFLAMTVAHEGSPGHAEHHLHASLGPYAAFLDLLHNAVAREGWGMNAEAQVSTVDPEATGICAYHLIRRLLPAAEQLVRLIDGEAAARALRRDCASRSPELAAEMNTPGRFGSIRPLVYAAGLVSTEHALDELAAAGRTGQHGGALLRRYVALGAVAPGRAVRAVTESE
jgi:hypothetical protein